MNTDESPRVPHLNDEWIDRIADGVLSPNELRDAVRILDLHPDGWKRFGMAVLEAQCWQDALRSDTKPVIRCIPAPAANGPRPARWLRGAIAAASVAASFALGWFIHSPRQAGPRELNAITPGIELTENKKAPDSTSMPASLPIRRISIAAALSSARPTIHEVARLQIGSERSRAEVPILAGPGIDADWAKKQPAPLSEYETVALQRQGYQVDQRRRLISATLSDGRRVTIPVDRVQIRYRGIQSL